MVTYWVELRSKVCWLRAQHPGQARLLPDTPPLGFVLLHQVHAGLLLSHAFASSLSQLGPWMRPGACKAWDL
jgi:hypothetical protein